MARSGCSRDRNSTRAGRRRRSRSRRDKCASRRAPRLQTQPFKDIYTLRESEREKLTTYGWVDQSAGIVRMPIEDALRILSERGGVPVGVQTPAGLNQVVQDSSSGRTAAPR